LITIAYQVLRSAQDDTAHFTTSLFHRYCDRL
jgi:hypothetical protein